MWKVYSNECLPQEIRKISNHLTLYLSELEKEEQMKPKAQVNRRKEIIKFRWKLNEIDKIDKPLARLTKKKRGLTIITEIGESISWFHNTKDHETTFISWYAWGLGSSTSLIPKSMDAQISYIKWHIYIFTYNLSTFSDML